jgi:hypothetical protein
MAMNDLLPRIEAFIEKEGIKPTSFGQMVVADPGFVFGLRKGRSPRKATASWVCHWLQEAANGNFLAPAVRATFRGQSAVKENA